jgi:hypothetical protein
MRWHREIMRGIRDNAAYEIFRLVILAIVLPLGYGVWSLARQQSLEWGILLGFVVVGLVILVFALVKLRKKGANFSDSGSPTIAFPKREREAKLRSVIVKVRDLINSTAGHPLSERYDVLGGLVKYSDDLESEQEVRSVCEELEHEFGHPFKLLEKESNNALQGEWLQFLRDARVSRSEIKTLMNAIGWAATRWRNAERWKQGRREVTGIYPASEPQPLIVAIDELKALKNEGEKMFGGYYVSQYPTHEAVEDYILRTRNAARQKTLQDAVRPRDLAKFEEPWELDEALLRKKAELQDAGLVDFNANDPYLGPTFDRLYGRIERLKELIGTIESR